MAETQVASVGPPTASFTRPSSASRVLFEQPPLGISISKLGRVSRRDNFLLHRLKRILDRFEVAKRRLNLHFNFLYYTGDACH